MASSNRISLTTGLALVSLGMIFLSLAGNGVAASPPPLPPSAGHFVDATETGEGGEELVVAAGAGGGDEAAHGEGVDEGVVEFLILEG